MAKKRSTNGQVNTNKDTGWAEVAWVNVALPSDAAELIQQHYADDFQTAGWLLGLCSIAQNVFVKYDSKTSSYCAGMIAPDPAADGALKGVSGWSDDPLNAVRALLFKWYHVMNETWPEVASPSAARFR